MRMTVRVDSDVPAGLRRTERQITAGCRRAVHESAEDLADRERADAAVDTGRLRRGVDVEYDLDGLNADVGERDPERLDVAEFVEHGTSSMPARPFVTPNVELERLRMPGRVEAAVRAELGA